MNRIFFAVLLLLCSRPAGACSVIQESALYNVRQADAMFEGDIRQIYLNGVAVAFRDFWRFLDQSNGTVAVTVHIAPSLVYFGNVADPIDIHTSYNSNGFCGTGPGFEIGQKTWVIGVDRTGPTPRAVLHFFSDTVIAAMRNTAEYKNHIDDALGASDLSESARASIAHEQALLKRVLKADKTLRDEHFFSSPQGLARWPVALLEARLTFLKDMGMPPNTIIDTQSAILLKR